MPLVLEAVCLLIAAAGSLLCLVRQFQMLQQNSYFASRYTKWLKDSFSLFAILPYLAMIVLTVWGALLGADTFRASMLFFSAVAFFFGWRAAKRNAASIKKLVFTARIRRTFVFSGCVLLAIGLAGLCTGGWLKCLLYAIFYGLIFCPPVLCLLSLFALKPVEKSVSNHYVKDAKRLLASVKGLKVIGITGSYGKTGTKYILSRILSEKYNLLMTPQSFNTPMGVVRTVREQLRADTEIFVCEMGAKKVGDIGEICDIVHPDAGLITSVGPQHLDTFGSIKNVADTKFELADAVAGKGGLLLANGDNEYIREKAENRDILLYGTKSDLRFYAENITGGRDGAAFDLCFDGERMRVTTKLLGRHNVQNITGAAALAYLLGVPMKDIAFAVSRLTPVEHRLELKTSVKGSLLIDDAYNANPEGCLEAVNVLGSFEGMQKVIITPGLVELGEKEYEYNKALGNAAAKVCDKIILVGKKRSVPLADGAKEAGFDEHNLFVAESFRQAMEIYTGFAEQNTVVLLENDLPDNYLM